MTQLFLHGMGHFHPENVIDNAFLENLDIGTNNDWIIERVGIRQRRTVLPLDYIRDTLNTDPRAALEAAEFDNAETAACAARIALDRAGLAPEDIGMVISGGCYPDMAIPAEASRVAAALGADAPGVDINTACSSFGAQMHFLANMTGLSRFVLVVNPENTTRAVDYSDRATAVLWGDGSSAAVVSSTESAPARIVHTTLAADSQRWNAVCIPRHGHFGQDGNAVQRFAIKTTLSLVQDLLPEATSKVTSTGGFLHFIGHQANLLMLQSVTRRAGLDEQSHWHNVADYGNTGAAGAPCVLSQHWDELGEGDSVVIAVVGSGLTWSSLRMEVG
ncbi:MAG: ketoacyl-ACP synthase III [Candidatus Latescibacterota bacterium]|nr:ketoacyl-ACP synthase III [Candidatus Latescibacterota bacterium]